MKTRVTTLVNHETGHICIMAITDDNTLIELDVPMDLAGEIEEAIAKGRRELEN
jgi:hypothetical protein